MLNRRCEWVGNYLSQAWDFPRLTVRATHRATDEAPDLGSRLTNKLLDAVTKRALPTRLNEPVPRLRLSTVQELLTIILRDSSTRCVADIKGFACLHEWY